jgi:shikimate 5-dehydrogenase
MILLKMDINWNDIAAEFLKVFGAGGVGSAVGYHARKQAAKTEMVQELDKLKAEYKEFAEYTKTELKDVQQQLEKTKTAEEECYQRHREALARIDELDRGIRALTNIPPKPHR